MRHFAFFVWICLGIVAPAFATSNDVLALSVEQGRALGIAVAHPRSTDFVPRQALPGRIILSNESVWFVTSRLPGVIVSMSVAPGDSVVAGQELARIESSSLISRQRDYLEALSDLALAESTARREEELSREGIIAGRRAASSRSLWIDARSRVEERRQALMLVGMEESEVDELARTRHLDSTLALRASHPGTVLEQYVRVGEGLETGGNLYRIGDLESLIVEVHAPLALARTLDEGARFSLPEEGAEGRVTAIGSEVHALDQGVLVRGRIEKGGSGLRPGQFVLARFALSERSSGIVAVVSRAVVYVDGQAWVFREVEGGFEPIAIDVVASGHAEAFVSGPLDTGTRIAVRGSAALKAYWLQQRGRR